MSWPLVLSLAAPPSQTLTDSALGASVVFLSCLALEQPKNISLFNVSIHDYFHLEH